MYLLHECLFCFKLWKLIFVNVCSKQTRIKLDSHEWYFVCRVEQCCLYSCWISNINNQMQKQIEWSRMMFFVCFGTNIMKDEQNKPLLSIIPALNLVKPSRQYSDLKTHIYTRSISFRICFSCPYTEFFLVLCGILL